MFANMFAKMFATLALFATLVNASSDHPVPESDPLHLTNSTANPMHDMSAPTTRSSYYCEWTYWNNMFWTGLTEVKVNKQKSFRKCALACCRNKYCATFDWGKRNKECYQYNENLNDGLEYYDDTRVWKAGTLTLKNGHYY